MFACSLSLSRAWAKKYNRCEWVLACLSHSQYAWFRKFTMMAAQVWCLPCPIHMETLTLWLKQDANKWPLYKYKTNQQNLRITYLSKQAIWTFTKSKCRSVTEQFHQSWSVQVIRHHKRKLSSLPLLNRLPLESQAVNKTTQTNGYPRPIRAQNSERSTMISPNSPMQTVHFSLCTHPCANSPSSLALLNMSSINSLF
jgi:hypothetical protein